MSVIELTTGPSLDHRPQPPKMPKAGAPKQTTKSKPKTAPPQPAPSYSFFTLAQEYALLRASTPSARAHPAWPKLTILLLPVEITIHSLLHLRSIYPSQSFLLRNKTWGAPPKAVKPGQPPSEAGASVRCWASRHEGVTEFIGRSVEKGMHEIAQVSLTSPLMVWSARCRRRQLAWRAYLGSPPRVHRAGRHDLCSFSSRIVKPRWNAGSSASTTCSV